MVSANASFILFLEIGPLPRRDRSYSASRSVRFRLEIGRNPRRDCGVSGHLRQGACFGCGGPRWAGSRGWRSCESGWTAPSRLRRCPCLPGAVDVAHSRALGVGGNRGIMRKSTISSGHGLAPMCAVPLTAHGSPTTTHHAHRKIPSFQQKTVTSP